MCIATTTINKYGKGKCLEALKLNEAGNGGYTIGYDLCTPEEKENFTCDFQFEDLGDQLIDAGKTLN